PREPRGAPPGCLFSPSAWARGRHALSSPRRRRKRSRLCLCLPRSASARKAGSRHRPFPSGRIVGYDYFIDAPAARGIGIDGARGGHSEESGPEVGVLILEEIV